MKTIQILFILLLPYCFLNAQNPGKSYALVVGISDYKDSLITDLQFAERDALIFSEFLRSKTGGEIPENQIKLLLGQDATVSKIYSALDWIKSKVKDGDHVYFYFAGHGDVESSLYKLGFLLTYDSPYQNYLNNAIRIEDINNFANTLSTNPNDIINTILITDACHSGKLAGSDNRGTSLVGEQLAQVQDQEIRIVSCGPDQKSLESIVWGGGRGVFSFYLVNGMKGLADTDKNKIVTLQELKTYVEENVSNDVRTIKLKKQNPVIAGKPVTVISKVTETPISISIDSSLATLKISDGARDVISSSKISNDSIGNFFRHYRNIDLTMAMDLEKLIGLQRAEVPEFVLNNLGSINSTASNMGFDLDSLQLSLKQPGYRTKFNYEFAAMLHNQVQEAINSYMRGDETELEKRRYYNVKSNNYDKYPLMIQAAMMLIEKDHYLYRILELKLHYFKGIAARLKIPSSNNQDSLIQSALKEQQIALQLEEKAAYVHNELGILNEYLNKIELSKKFYEKAIELSPTWGIPKANLSGILFLQKKYNEGIKIGLVSKSLLPKCQVSTINLGRNYQGMGNWLLAEEQYRNSIELNAYNYFPFQALGNLYLHNLDYALADSFYLEADIRTRGYNFKKIESPSGWDLNDPTIAMGPERQCMPGTNTMLEGPQNIMECFYQAMVFMKDNDYVNTKRLLNQLIAVDPKNPLAFFYLGQTFAAEKNYMAAELNFKYARMYHLERDAFEAYFDTLLSTQSNPSECARNEYDYKYFYLSDLYHEMGNTYQNWKYYDKAKEYFYMNVQIQPEYERSYSALWNLFEEQEKYDEAEEVINQFSAQYRKGGAIELYNFYKRRIEKNPNDIKYYIKAGKFLHFFAQQMDGYSETDYITIDKDNSDADFDFSEPKSTPTDDNSSRRYKEPNIDNPKKDGVVLLRKAIDLTSDSSTKAFCYDMIGDFYNWAGSKKRALQNYKNAVELNPNQPDTRNKLIAFCNELYHFESGLASLLYLKEKNQIDYDKMLLLADYEIKRSNFEQANIILKELNTLHPKPQADVNQMQAKSQFISGKLQEAQKYYLDQAKIDPNNKNTEYTIARIYALNSKNKLAIAWLQKALENGFDYGWVINNDPAWNKLRTNKILIDLKPLIVTKMNRGIPEIY